MVVEIEPEDVVEGLPRETKVRRVGSGVRMRVGMIL